MQGLNPACLADWHCIRRCHCEDPVSGLACLAFVYHRFGKADDNNNPTIDFVRGHLAVLLGLLMCRSDTNQLELLAVLPGISNADKVNNLINQIQEFIMVYSKFITQLATTTSRNNDIGDIVDSDVIQWKDWGIAGMLRDRKSEHAAYDVISHLKGLYN